MAGVLTMRRGISLDEPDQGACTPSLRVPQSSLVGAAGVVSPFRNFLGLLKPPPLPTSYSGGAESRESSPRASIDSVESTLTLLGGDQRRSEGRSVVMVAFDGSVKELSHSGIVWAMENVLKRGDVLAVVSILDSVRGPLGYRVRIGETGNQRVVEEEVQQRMEAWRSFPGLERRCEEGGVTLLVTVKSAPRIEVAIGKEAVKLGACHVVLDKSMKNRHRTFYATNLTCDVTRMRRSGGVDVIRPAVKWVEPRSPTSVIPGPQPPPVLSYGDQIDEFEIALRPKRKPVVPKAFPKVSLDRLSLPTTDERSATSTASTPSVRGSVTSSSNAEDDMDDDDLFSICHGSARHDGLNASSFPSSGYESDDLFSIGEGGSARRPPFHSHHHSTSSLPDTGEPEPLQQATMARIKLVGGVGEAMTLTLQSPLRPGEGLLVGNSPSALFLMHTDSNQNGSTTLSTATPSSYIAMDGQMAMKLSFLEPGQRVLAVDSQGRCRTIRVENAGAHKKPLVLVEAQCDGRRHSVLLHHADTVAALHPHHHSLHLAPSPVLGAQSPVHGVVAVKGLKVGDRVLLRLRAEPTHAIWS